MRDLSRGDARGADGDADRRKQRVCSVRSTKRTRSQSSDAQIKPVSVGKTSSQETRRLHPPSRRPKGFTRHFAPDENDSTDIAISEPRSPRRPAENERKWEESTDFRVITRREVRRRRRSTYTKGDQYACTRPGRHDQLTNDNNTQSRGSLPVERDTSRRDHTSPEATPTRTQRHTSEEPLDGIRPCRQPKCDHRRARSRSRVSARIAAVAAAALRDCPKTAMQHHAARHRQRKTMSWPLPAHSSSIHTPDEGESRLPTTAPLRDRCSNRAAAAICRARCRVLVVVATNRAASRTSRRACAATQDDRPHRDTTESHGSDRYRKAYIFQDARSTRLDDPTIRRSTTKPALKFEHRKRPPRRTKTRSSWRGRVLWPEILDFMVRDAIGIWQYDIIQVDYNSLRALTYKARRLLYRPIMIHCGVSSRWKVVSRAGLLMRVLLACPSGKSRAADQRINDYAEKPDTLAVDRNEKIVRSEIRLHLSFLLIVGETRHGVITAQSDRGR